MTEKEESMDEESWNFNLGIALLDMKSRIKKKAKEIKEKNPDISKRELSKKLNDFQAREFKDEYNHLVFEHPARNNGDGS